MTAVNNERLAQHLNDALRQDGGIGRLGKGDLQNHELVAAHACDRVRFAHDGAQSVGHLPQKSVAGRMTQRIVDVLEVVEIEQVDCEGLPTPDADKRLLQSLIQQCTVRQPRQPVMMS